MIRGFASESCRSAIWRRAKQLSVAKLMKPRLKSVLGEFSVELPVYALLVIVYVVCVLHFLRHWLFHLFTRDRNVYAVVSLGLMLGQGFLLDLCVRSLLGLIRGKQEH